MILRRKTFAALVAACSIVLVAAPSGAATDALDDATGDVTDENGAGASDARIDITGVTFDNSIDGLELTIEVADVVPFSDDAWISGELVIGAGLDESASIGDTAEFTWLLFADGSGSAFGLLGPAESALGCITDATQTASAYVLTAGRACSSSVPRNLAFGAVGASLGDELLLDIAPDDGDLSGPITSGDRGVTRRLAGNDRILTSIALSEDTFDDNGAGAVVLAASQSFPDALAGGPLAYVNGAPLLLTGAAGLDARVATELARVLEPGGTVYVLGGTAALSEQVVTDARADGFTVRRVAGPDRFATAIAIADELDADEIAHATVLIADGRAFTDALIASAVAPSVAGVVVLTDGATMPAATADYLGSDDTEHIAIGSQASTAATGVRRIVGANPSELSVNVADELLPIRGSVAIASQATFADALAGGPHVAASLGPLLLTDPQTLSVAARDAIEAADGSLRRVVVYGGTAAVSAGVVDALNAALAP